MFATLHWVYPNGHNVVLEIMLFHVQTTKEWNLTEFQIMCPIIL